MEPPERVQRPLERVPVVAAPVVVAEQAGGSDVADKDAEIEQGRGELGVDSEEEDGSDAEGREDYCED